MVRGADHPDTLSVRAWLARTSGDGGRFDDAVAQYQELAGDYARVLGADHRITLTSRANLAHFTGRAGRAAEACAQLGAVRDDRIRVFGPDDPGVISARKLLAYWRERPPGWRRDRRLQPPARFFASLAHPGWRDHHHHVPEDRDSPAPGGRGRQAGLLRPYGACRLRSTWHGVLNVTVRLGA